MNKTVLITGANSGLGKDTARQFALKPEVTKVYLACRNIDKARIAKQELVKATGRDIFEIIIIDVSNLGSVNEALPKLNTPIDYILLNAGGLGGKTPNKITRDGVTQIFASNVLGNLYLLERLLEKGLIKESAVFAGSEAARGVPMMGIKKPILTNSSVQEFEDIANGSYFKTDDAMFAYGYIKYMGALVVGKLARLYPEVRILTMSPGGTNGTNAMNDLKGMMKVMFKTLGPTLMPLFGMMHSLDKGAKRFVDALEDPKYQSGVFYASKGSTTTGPVVEQTQYYPELADARIQDNAYAALAGMFEPVTVAA